MRVTLVTEVTGEDEGGWRTVKMASRDELSDVDDGSLQHHSFKSVDSVDGAGTKQWSCQLVFHVSLSVSHSPCRAVDILLQCFLFFCPHLS